MAEPRFTFLSLAEFERLTSKEKLAYLSSAMAELERNKMAQTGWDSLFRNPVTQQQQQPQSRTDPKKPESQ